MHPRLNAKGSSGSYFVQDGADSKTLAIFKPSDEDPYGAMNPKVLKWLHRSLHHLAPRVVPFGRSCLIPGQSYLSESAASVLDRHLESWIVPRTQVVKLRSEAFYYDWVDRERAKKGVEELREKDGSFQVFLKGFTGVSTERDSHPLDNLWTESVRDADGSDFLRQHPYPPTSRPAAKSTGRTRSSLILNCFPCCGSSPIDDSPDDAAPIPESPPEASSPEFEWTPEMVESFQLELEKLVVLDYLIRNTDRGLDNFMIKPCLPAPDDACRSSVPTSKASPERPHLHIAAIDNSLAFPHTHPQGWRSYPFGWLYLPLGLLDNPWSCTTRSHYLQKLEDPEWWSRVHRDLREEFRQGRAWTDEDDRAWLKQWSLVKGQGWNLAKSLHDPNEGPLELCRRKKVLVWDDFVLESEKRADESEILDISAESKKVRDSPMLAGSNPSNPAVSVSYSRVPTMVSKPPPLSHRRTLSDYTSNYGSTSRTPRPGFTSSKSDERRSASLLRKPLDSLASSPKRPFKNLLLRHSSTSSSSSSMSRLREGVETAEGELEGRNDEGDDQEETGYTFLEKLDKLEASEQKRAKKVQKEAKRLGLFETEDRGATPRGFRRQEGREATVNEQSRLLSATSEASEDDDDDGDEALGAGWGTTSEIILDGRGQVGARDRGRLSMSWYGEVGSRDRTSCGIEEVLNGAERQDQHPVGGPSSDQTQRKKWVVLEVCLRSR